MIYYLQLICHLVGDYILQSDYQALNKRRNPFVCWVHAVLYTLPFLLLTHSPSALFAITGSHWFIDFFGLARYVGFAKNYLAPPWAWPIWEDTDWSGYNKDRPEHIKFILFVLTDNTMHLICNFLALEYL